MGLVNAEDVYELRGMAMESSNRASYLLTHHQDVGAETEAVVCMLMAINANLTILNDCMAKIHKSMGDGTLMVDH